MSDCRRIFPTFSFRLTLAVSGLFTMSALPGFADEVPTPNPVSDARPFVLKREITAPPLSDGRKVIIQIGEPVEYVAPVEVAPAGERTGTVPQNRPTSTLPKNTRLLSISATVYPNINWTRLSWWQPQDEDGPARELSAWSRAAYGGLHLTNDFDLPEIDTRFILFPIVVAAGTNSPPVPPEVLALPADHSGFVPVGEAADSPVMAPARALHAIHIVEGAELSARWSALQAEHAAEAARLAANPPPVEDEVIQIRPLVFPKTQPVNPQ